MITENIDVSYLLENLSPTFWKKGRLQTFAHWPFKTDENQCNPNNMATAGFFAIGGENEPDLVECFICSKQLDGWDPDDDPWKEHKKHQPRCPFINLNKPDEGSVTIKELFQLMTSYYKQKQITNFEKAIEELKNEWKNSAETIPEIYEAMKKNMD